MHLISPLLKALILMSVKIPNIRDGNNRKVQAISEAPSSPTFITKIATPLMDPQQEQQDSSILRS